MKTDLEKQINLRVIQIGAVVLKKVHELKAGKINRKEYNRQLDDILFPNITREILDLINQQTTTAIDKAEAITKITDREERRQSFEQLRKELQAKPPVEKGKE